MTAGMDAPYRRIGDLEEVAVFFRSVGEFAAVGDIAAPPALVYSLLSRVVFPMSATGSWSLLASEDGSSTRAILEIQLDSPVDPLRELAALFRSLRAFAGEQLLAA
jgi:hypothetical protein